MSSHIQYDSSAVEMGGWWVLAHPASHQLMLSGHKLTKAHCFSAKAT
ncbi:hypothetical protein GUQ72_003251 [Salmonella enterica subsp. enterica]|nr:hypothetical protein [Salmonella enterica subsp. enterica serovar Tudu]